VTSTLLSLSAFNSVGEGPCLQAVRDRTEIRASSDDRPPVALFYDD
jgi:hypothetical protein